MDNGQFWSGRFSIDNGQWTMDNFGRDGQILFRKSVLFPVVSILIEFCLVFLYYIVGATIVSPMN